MKHHPETLAIEAKAFGGVGRRRVGDGKDTNNRVFAFTQDHQNDGARAVLHALFVACRASDSHR
jgi:hypothetical protein